MKQIYNFETHTPPALNENMLQAELERRRLRWQTALLTLAGVLFQAAIILLGYSAVDWYPIAAFFCFFHIVISTAGVGVVAAVYSRKGGNVLWTLLRPSQH